MTGIPELKGSQPTGVALNVPQLLLPNIATEHKTLAQTQIQQYLKSSLQENIRNKQKIKKKGNRTILVNNNNSNNKAQSRKNIKVQAKILITNGSS